MPLFDEIIPRRDTNSYKWDSTEADVLPMWVADMDFKACPAVLEALRRRVEHGVFGYTKVPESFYASTINWFRQRHGWTIERPWMIYTSGVVPALSAIIKALTEPGDKVILQTPVYNCFFSSVRNNGCEVLANPLLRRGDTFVMDYDDLRRKAADPRAKLLVLCNPHNPVGRAWTREELSRLNDICLENGVRVVADEIHCELVMPGYEYVPFAAVSEACQHNAVVCNSPSKSFNTAGLQIANIISDDPATLQLIDRAININEVCDVNPFGVEALMAAYDHGAEWIDELCSYLADNYSALRDYFAERLPHIGVTRLEATYLVWLDCKALGLSSDELTARLERDGRVLVNSGTMYGAEGEGYIRVNIACPRSRMMDGLERIAKVLGSINR